MGFSSEMKQNLFYHLINDLTIDIIGLSETKLTNTTSIEYNIKKIEKDNVITNRDLIINSLHSVINKNTYNNTYKSWWSHHPSSPLSGG